MLEQPVGDKIAEYQEYERVFEPNLFSNEAKMISRREFVQLAGITPLGTIVLPESVANGEATDRRSNAGKANKPLMYPGTQKSSTKRMLQFYKRCGVNNICGNPDRWSRAETDTVYKRSFKQGEVVVPWHSGTLGSNYGVPSMAFVKSGKAEKLDG